MQRVSAVLRNDFRQSIAFLDYRHITAFPLDRNFYLCNLYNRLVVLLFNAVLVYIGGYNLFFFHRNSAFIVLYDAEYRHAHYLLVSAAYFVVGKVLTVQLSRDTSPGTLLNGVLESYQCTAAVGNDGITVKLGRACTHIRQNSYIGKRVSGFVESYTVCRETYGEAVLVEIILESHSEQSRVGILAGILCYQVVFLKCLVCIVWAELADDLFDKVELAFGSIRVENVDRHFLCNGER